MKRALMFSVAAVIFAVLLAAQTAPATPKIPVELLKNFYAADADQQRAQRELDLAQRHVESARASWQQAVVAMQKECGDNFQLYQDQANSDPQCKAKPAEKK